MRVIGKWRDVCHGDWEGEWVVARGRICYSFEDDKFRVYDTDSKRVFFGDDGFALESWLIENGWVPAVCLTP